MKHKTKILTSLFLLAAGVLSLKAAHNHEVVKKHGLGEGVDQAAHYLWGYWQTKKHIFNNALPCESIQKTTDFAIRREFYQKDYEKQLNGEWCHEGCQRDLKYWYKGILDASPFNKEKHIKDVL